MTFLIVMACILFYGGMGGATGYGMFQYFDNNTDMYDPEIPAFIAGMLWPIGLPAGLGALAISKTGLNPDHVDKNTRNQQKEIDQAQHKVKLAELEANRIRVLEREAGIK